jgi:glycosyltransferase involved in cell wall biosynthesis
MKPPCDSARRVKRLLHVWQSHYPWEVRVGKINRALRAAGCEVTVVARRGPGEPETEAVDSVVIRRVGPARFPLLSTPLPGNPFWSRGIEGAIREVQPDAILVRDIPLALTAGRLGRRHAKPVFLDMAEHYPEAMRCWQKYSSGFRRKLVHDWRLPDRIEAAALPLMEGILVVCEEQKDRLVREYSYPAERICVVLNTPEREAWTNVRKGTSRRKPFLFGYHGVLNEGRELEVVLKGFDRACAAEPDLRLLIAGGGESEGSLRAFAEGLASRDKIEFTGRFAPERLLELYSRVDFGVLSLRANTFTRNTLANKLFDYAALGKPFIYPGLGPLERVMSRMRCGVAFEPGSAESAAAAFREVRRADYEALSRRGLESIDREFNWTADSSRMLEFLTRRGRARGAA